eukprot:TRINITY_DN3353_c0_g2_i1.p1 TRINITY_DN3353_c0_g2~~TRINITY_DN3353_c0_g2_i1.p1  ORF type:complete len:629 (+),score=138.74 TRINITY_DN3353_c0_g2_i1:380-2266(+)
MVFTGIVQLVGEARFDKATNILSIATPAAAFWSRSRTGDSISVNGVCLTLLPRELSDDDNVGRFFVMAETRSKTSFGGLDDDEAPFFVNLEHALRVGDSVSGHTVIGHVDGTVTVWKIKLHPDGSRDLWVDLAELPKEFVVYKGSIALDGVSLTVAEIAEGRYVRVSLIPHTLSHTTLQYRKVGDSMNVEFDQVLKKLTADGHHAAAIAEPTTTGEQTNGWTPSQVLTRTQDELDMEFMRQAVSLGDTEGRLTAPPNPWVASLLVGPGGVVLGRGVHVKAGEPHAEVLALRDAESRLGDELEAALPYSTLYVTLEPCHHHGRTPPCDQLLIQKKVRRVVVATLDPDARVSGEGVKSLRENGIEVVVGVEESKVKESLRSYLHHRSTGLPYVVVKVGLTIDSKIACRDGTSQWITGSKAREDAHNLRAQSQAIVVGSGTAIIDKPRLTVRTQNSKALNPLRVVLDSSGRLGGTEEEVAQNPLFDFSLAPTLIFTTAKSRNTPARVRWESMAASYSNVDRKFELIEVKGEEENGRVSLDAMLTELGKKGILQVMVEGGSEIHAQLLKKGLVDELVVYQGPFVFGGGKTLSWPAQDVESPDGETISKAKRWQLSDLTRLEDDVKLVYRKLI